VDVDGTSRTAAIDAWYRAPCDGHRYIQAPIAGLR